MKIIDGDNFFRRSLETDTSGGVLRNLIRQTEHTPGAIIWVWDGWGAKKKRQAIFPAYKSKRPPLAESIKESRNLFQAALLHTKAIQIRVHGYEADDVVATLARKYSALGEPVEIESNDKDLLQLHGGLVKVLRDQVPGVPPEMIRLWKTLVGDPSDEIPGIPGLGEKAFQACNKQEFLALLQDPDANLDGLGVYELRPMFDVMPKVAAWLETGLPQLRAMWAIIGFLDVPYDEIVSNTLAGTSNPDKVNEIFSEFLQ